MRDETVRRVYLGGSDRDRVRARKRRSAIAATPLLDVRDRRRALRQGAGAATTSRSTSTSGEFVSVVGLNGAGKTTLFNAISGLVPYSRRDPLATARRCAAAPPRAIARGGIVQCPETRELFGDMSVRENLDLGGQHLRGGGTRAQQLEWLFDLFPILRERQRQAARTLSGGEQQMLAIARALMMQPKLLILDEPTLGLAPVILEQLSKALERLRQTTPITVLLGEQNVTFALPHADRVYVLEHARIVWEGEPARFAAEAGTGYL